MPGIYELASRLIQPGYYRFFVIFVLFIVFSVAGYYAYTSYMGVEKSPEVSTKEDAKDKSKNIFEWLNNTFWGDKSKYTENLEVVKSGDIITVYFFTADWCPHCRSAKPTIDKFDEKYNNKTINGKKIIIKRVDCTDSDNADVSKIINTFDVKSFPTVLIQDDNKKRFDFDAKITDDNLENFVKTVANN